MEMWKMGGNFSLELVPPPPFSLLAIRLHRATSKKSY